MKTIESPAALPHDLMAELEEACADAITGVRRPDKMAQTARELDEGREEIRSRLGVLEFSAELTDPDE